MPIEVDGNARNDITAIISLIIIPHSPSHPPASPSSAYAACVPVLCLPANNTNTAIDSTRGRVELIRFLKQSSTNGMQACLTRKNVGAECRHDMRAAAILPAAERNRSSREWGLTIRVRPSLQLAPEPPDARSTTLKFLTCWNFDLKKCSAS